MTNDGWGKPTQGWGKPDGWTTQQAVDKAVEVLRPTVTEIVKNVAAKADITNPTEGWSKPECGKPIFNIVDDAPHIDQSIEATQLTVINEKEIEFLLAREVKLNLSSKLFPTECLKIGDLAIHDDIQDADYFCISHVPTLTSFMKAVPTETDKEYTNDQLVLWCTKVQRSHKDEWTILRGLTPDSHSPKNNELAYEAALRIREWCLSVPIE